MSNLRKCCSDEDLSTAPWSFFSSFTVFLLFLYPLNDVRKSLKVLIESLHIQLITSQKQPLAPRDIINNAPAVNRKSLKVLIESLHIQLITSQKQPLAPRDIINKVNLRILACILDRC